MYKYLITFMEHDAIVTRYYPEFTPRIWAVCRDLVLGTGLPVVESGAVPNHRLNTQPWTNSPSTMTEADDDGGVRV